VIPKRASRLLLAFVPGHSSSGSAIVFDYVYRHVLDGVQTQKEISGMRRIRLMTGEGLAFGIAEGSLGIFLKEGGFCQEKDVNAGDLRRAYFTGLTPVERWRVGMGS